MFALMLVIFLATNDVTQFVLRPDSPLIGTGASVPSAGFDFCNTPRPYDHPSIGAFDVNSGPDCVDLTRPRLDPPTIIDVDNP